MLQSGDLSGVLPLDYETWTETLRSRCARYSPADIEPKAFAGWLRPINVCAFSALNIGSNAARVERTYRDARLDGIDHYFVLFQVAGQLALKHNDQAVRLAAGDVALVDTARPATYIASNGTEPWNDLALDLPREELVTHLGFEPHGGSYRHGGAPADRLLLDLVRSSDRGEGSAFSPAASYMRLAVYDLVGALFAPSDPWPVSRHAEKLFARICGLARDGLADPDFGPVELAAEAGISLRYLHKLFTARGRTCSEFIYSLRLDHAVHLLQRRALVGTGQPLSEIAYACGFRDYSHFARKFRRRFGYPPGGGLGQNGRSDHAAAHVSADGNAS